MQFNSNDIKLFILQQMSDFLDLGNSDDFINSFDTSDELYSYLLELHKIHDLTDLTEILKIYVDYEMYDYYLEVKKFIALEININ